VPFSLPATSRVEVALVHDYLTQRGGAERVVLSMLRLFPKAPLYTALYEPDATFPEFADHDIRPLWTNRVAALRRSHRRGLLLYPLAFSGLQVDADVTVCSSSGFAHGVRVTGRKVVYCHSPARWLYDQADTYLAGWPAPLSAAVRTFAPALRRWDRRASASADTYLANSGVVRDRISRAYGIEATVVAPSIPAVAAEKVRPLPGIAPGYMLCVSRLLAYKNIEAVSSSFRLLPEARLIVVGTGPLAQHLRGVAGDNVTLIDRVDDAQLAWLYANCRGVVSAAHEDFGLTAMEANSFGKPVAVLHSGGFLDTVVDGQTGVFFDEPRPAGIAVALRRLLATSWDPELIHRHAEYFTEDSFRRRLLAALAPPPVFERTAVAKSA
jgi:glycosyltransferase involved in cell wall biosynthesis